MAVRADPAVVPPLESLAGLVELSERLGRERFKVVGGRAIFRRYPLERHIRDARGAPVMPPAGDKCLETIGKTLFGLSAATIQT